MSCSVRPCYVSCFVSDCEFPLSTLFFLFFFFNDTATTEIYTLSLHDALPICAVPIAIDDNLLRKIIKRRLPTAVRSEEHTSELQSRQYLVCRLLLEKKKYKYKKNVSVNKE